MKGTKLTLGGRERTLRYDLNAVAEIGDRLGLEVRIASLGDDIFSKPLPLSALRTVIWAGLIHEEPDLTEKEVGAWIDEDNWAEVFKVFFSRFGATSQETQAKILRGFGAPVDEEEPTPVTEEAVS